MKKPIVLFITSPLVAQITLRYVMVFVRATVVEKVTTVHRRILFSNLHNPFIVRAHARARQTLRVGPIVRDSSCRRRRYAIQVTMPPPTCYCRIVPRYTHPLPIPRSRFR